MAKRRRKTKATVGESVGKGLAVAGRWLGTAAAGAGRSIASAYQTIDPDLRRHVAQMPLAGISMLAARERAVEPLADDGFPPILMVHGLGGHRGNFIGMQAMLRLSGRTRTYALGFPAEMTLEAQAEAVRRTVQEILRVNRLGKKGRVDLVAHSMGGLVARLALVEKSTRARVRVLVTLGTPHAGTFVARFGASAHIRELRPGSETLRTLKRQLPWRHPPRLVCLWSPSDVFLLPPTSACVEGAENVEMPGFTHLSYLVHPRAAKAVLDALGPAPG